MELRQLVKEVPYLLETRGDMSVEIAALCSNSREKTENGIFFCFAGAHFDAHQYAPQAVQNGCVALVVERFLDDVNVPQVLVSNGRAAMARISEAFFNHPERKMRFVGITGTKGKTTTSYMVKSICEQAGFKCGLVGTTGNMIGEKHIPSSKTTPDPIDLMRDLNEMVQAGVQVVVMEVSAHALDMHRLDGMTFECGCYTNLSQDHLDYFGTMENYFQCKKAFFTSGMAKNAAINADDERAAELLRDVTIPHMTYGIAAEADLFARDIEITENGVSFELRLRNAEYIQINLRMTGMFNVYNALSAAACALILGVSPENVRAGLENIHSVPGRIEMLPTNTPYRVILDRDRLLLYRVEALKEMTPKTTRLLCSKAISLNEVEVEQTPDEARTNGLRLNSPFEKETYRLFRFFNDNEYSEWNRVRHSPQMRPSVFRRS